MVPGTASTAAWGTPSPGRPTGDDILRIACPPRRYRGLRGEGLEQDVLDRRGEGLDAEEGEGDARHRARRTGLLQRLLRTPHRDRSETPVRAQA